MVTRTIKSTLVKFLAVNLEDRSTVEMDVNLAGTYKDSDAIMKALKKVYDEEVKPVQVLDTEEVEKLYGMSEVEFVAHAMVIEKKGD